MIQIVKNTYLRVVNGKRKTICGEDASRRSGTDTPVVMLLKQQILLLAKKLMKSTLQCMLASSHKDTKQMGKGVGQKCSQNHACDQTGTLTCMYVGASSWGKGGG